MSNDATPALLATRRALHCVAELVLAGPQHDRDGTIRLRAMPGGFGTVTDPALRVRGGRAVGPRGEVEIDGRTAAEVAAAVGVAPRPLTDVYSGGPNVPSDERLRVDGDAAARLADVFAVGNEALSAFAPAEQPVIWPEHFDIGITVGEVNYGLSPGDAWSPAPYAYVGPWSVPAGDFWNAPFGATRPVTEGTTVEQVVAFFREGRDVAAQAQASASS
jgi:hypothetical protein